MISPKRQGDTPHADLFGADVMPSSGAITVSELNRRTRQTIESRLELVWVCGEISNLVRAASGHSYFSLKDDSAQVRCVLFRQRASAASVTLQNGMHVEVRALPSLYEPRGEFQLGVEQVRAAGLGARFEALERLKRKLLDEGLFAPERKRVLPRFPKSLGIVTSRKAAALSDVLTTLARRAPMIRVVLYPAAVQGGDAVPELVAALDAATARREVEALIVCRGGGSMEDLWAFNDEAVVRAIYRVQDTAHIPVVSGIGHETDFTLADFVADQRAPTPTAAAELLSPDVPDLRARIARQRFTLTRNMRDRISRASQRVDEIIRALLAPAAQIAQKRERLESQRQRLQRASNASMAQGAARVRLAQARLAARAPNVAEWKNRHGINIHRIDHAWRVSLARWQRQIALRENALRHLNPAEVLHRGYSIVRHEGQLVRNVTDVSAGDAITVQLAVGELGAEVKTVRVAP